MNKEPFLHQDECCLYFFPHKYDSRKQLYYMLTNDKAADLLKHFLVKAKRGKKKKLGLLERPASWTPREAGFPHLFFFQSLGSRGLTDPPSPFPGSGYSLSS